MSAYFTAADLARAEAVSRTLLSPLTAPSVDDWRRDVNTAMRNLFGGDAAVFMIPGNDVLYLSDEAPDLVAGLQQYAEISAEGLHVVRDPVVALWHEMRRSESMNAFSWATNEAMVKRRGEDMNRSPLVQDLLIGDNLCDFVGTYAKCRAGEVLLWILHEKPGGIRFGVDDASVMKALVPSLQVGLDTLDRMAAHRSTLDFVQEPMVVFDLGGRELHRNDALVRLMRDDPDAEILVGTARLIAGEACRSFAPLRMGSSAKPFAPAMRQVRTRRAQYDVRATIAAAGTFDRDESVLATIQPLGTTGLPGTDELRVRFGLTPREAEIAQLLTDGLSNAQIAERLFISLHTAKRHVEKVLDKLGAPSRSAVRARMMQPEVL